MLPPLPAITQTVTGRPHFDLWRDFDCAALDVPTCTNSLACTGVCIIGPSDELGVCSKYQDLDLDCGGEGEVLGYADEACWICAPLESHAQACCLGLPSFDCRRGLSKEAASRE